MIDALVDGIWYPVAHCYVDGTELVAGHDELDGQVILRWVEPGDVSDYRITTVIRTPPSVRTRATS